MLPISDPNGGFRVFGRFSAGGHIRQPPQ